MPRATLRPAVNLTALAIADRAARLNLGPVIEKFRAAGILSPRDAFKKPGKVRAALGERNDAGRRALGLLKLAHAAGDAGLAAKVLGAGGPSLAVIGRLPAGYLESKLGKIDAKQRAALRRLQRTARAVYRTVSETAATRQAAKAVLGTWLLDPKLPRPSLPGGIRVCFECECCDSIFGPRAYLFDLLDLIYYRWPLPARGLDEPRRITSDVLEAILLQEIDALDCKRGEEIVPQVRIGCEVLERFVSGLIPLADATWRTAFRKAWAALLAPGSDADAAIQGVSALDDGSGRPSARLGRALGSAQPSLAEIDAVAQALADLISSGGASAAPVLAEMLKPGFADRLAVAIPPLLAAYRARLAAAAGQTADALSRKLFIDLQAGECLVTTRFTQLIASLQVFILAIRTGEIRDITRPDLPGAVIDFADLDPSAVEEEDWKWLGDYTSWKAAMYTLIFPENVLPPPLKEPQLEQLAQTWSRGASPADVREGFLAVYFPPALLDAARQLQWRSGVSAANRARAKKVFDTLSYPTIYGSLDPWIADIERLAGTSLLQHWASDDTFPRDIVYLEFPRLAGWALNRAGQFAAAHDWYRRLYDANRPRSQRARFDFDSVLETGSRNDPDVIRRAGAAWLDDPLDPRLIARKRRGVYLRQVVLATVRNLLDWADHEFAHETAESIARAQALYLLARRTLDAPELDSCADALRFLELDIVLRQDIEYVPQRHGVRASVRRLRSVRQRATLDEAIAEIRNIVAHARPADVVPRVAAAVSRALARDADLRPNPRLGAGLTARRTAVSGFEDEMLFGFPPDPGPDPVPGGGGTPPTGPEPGSPRPGDDPLDWFRDHPQIDPGIPDADPPTLPGEPHGHDIPTAFLACVPENPLVAASRKHIDANLAKIRACLNVVGEPLRQALVSCDPAAGAAAAPAVDSSEQAPRYRYSFLSDKARQYVAVAQNLESSLVQAIEKREQAKFDILKARQAADLAGATVELRGLQVTEAESSRRVADLQANRADLQAHFWNDRLGKANTFDQTLSGLEKEGLFWSDVSWKLQAGAAIANAASVLPAIAGAVAGGEATAAGGFGGMLTAETGVGAVLGAIVGGAGLATMSLSLAAGLPGIAQSLSAAGGAAGAYANMQQTKAGYERRFQDWTLQRDLSVADQGIAAAGVTVAQNRVDIAEREEDISRLELTQSREVLEFLSTRLDNVELFEWMIDVLMRNYRTVMQLSTSIARLAQRALEFERQEPIQIILTDYSSVANTSVLAANLSAEQQSFGLLGAERLSADLTELDAYKVQTETRRLQMTKTLSLAQMMPVDFAQLRSTGQITFNTLMDWFDRDFPGHYLRLVRSVKVSVLALIPPLDGLHAMLHNGGESTVVVPQADPITREVAFVKRRAMRNFGESIALDAAFAESGLFELRADDPMLLPFEGLGVETQWTLELPQSFNRFSFETIADVLIQIDYTALLDFGYRGQVVKSLPARETTDSSFDLGFAFPDEWYQLKNPRPADPPADRVMSVTLPRAFFPPQFDATPPAGGGAALSVMHVALVVAGDFTALSPTGAEQQRLRNVIRDGIELEKDGNRISTTGPSTPGAPGFRFAEVSDRMAFFTTREAPTAQSPSHFAPTADATGGWRVRFRQPIFTETAADGRPLIRRIVNALMVITVQGHVTWS